MLKSHENAGVLPLAYGEAAGRHLQAQFAGRLVRKDYICLCEGPSLGETSPGVLCKFVRILQFCFKHQLFLSRCLLYIFSGLLKWFERSLALTWYLLTESRVHLSRDIGRRKSCSLQSGNPLISEGKLEHVIPILIPYVYHYYYYYHPINYVFLVESLAKIGANHAQHDLNMSISCSKGVLCCDRPTFAHHRYRWCQLANGGTTGASARGHFDSSPGMGQIPVQMGPTEATTQYTVYV